MTWTTKRVKPAAKLQHLLLAPDHLLLKAVLLHGGLHHFATQMIAEEVVRHDESRNHFLGL
jgi:hypothetical protein